MFPWWSITGRGGVEVAAVTVIQNEVVVAVQGQQELRV